MSTKTTARDAAREEMWEQAFRVSVAVFLVFSCSMVGIGLSDRMPSHEVPAGWTTTAGTGSMEPVLDGGEVLIYTDIGEVEEGDLIVFEDTARDIDIVHRVVGEEDAGYLTKGDANDHIDQHRGTPYATEENTYGRVLVHFEWPF